MQKPKSKDRRRPSLTGILMFGVMALLIAIFALIRGQIITQPPTPTPSQVLVTVTRTSASPTPPNISSPIPSIAPAPTSQIANATLHLTGQVFGFFAEHSIFWTGDRIIFNATQATSSNRQLFSIKADGTALQALT